MAKNRSDTPGVVSYDFREGGARVGIYYFYLLDPDFGPGFIKVCTYFPYPVKVWFNGTSGRSAKPTRPGWPTPPGPTFATWEGQGALQAIGDRLGPHHVQGSFDR